MTSYTFDADGNITQSVTIPTAFAAAREILMLAADLLKYRVADERR